MNNEKVFSFTKGYTFSFEDEGKKIDAWFSALSGLEKVFVDGKLVSSKRNLSFNSSSVFKIGDQEYSINMRAVSLIKGPFVCALHRNGKEFKRQKLVFPRAQSKTRRFPFFARFLFYIAVGGIFGFAWSYWRLPIGLLYLFVAVVFVVVFLYSFRVNMGRPPKIEDEEVWLLTILPMSYVLQRNQSHAK